MPRLGPSLTSVGIGVAAGAIRKADIDGARVELLRQWGTWFEVGLPALIFVLEGTRTRLFASDIMDAGFHSGLTLASERLGRSVLAGGGVSLPGAPRRISGASYVPASAYSAAGAVLRQPSGTLR